MYTKRMPSRTILATFLVVVGSQAFSRHRYYPSSPRRSLVRRASSVSGASIDSVCQNLNQAFQACQDEVAKTANVRIGNSPTSGRLGLLATKSIKKGDAFLAMPYDDRFMLTADIARNVVFKGKLPDKFEGWTGDAGLLALLILNEIARANNDNNDKVVQMPQRSDTLQAFMAAWVASLPSAAEMKELHPLLWREGDQEILQLSSTNKVYRVLDDIEEDCVWFNEHLFADRVAFPETVKCDGEEIPCFCLEGFRWAVALAQSRSVFVDGSLRILPVMDMCNHNDDGAEIKGGYMGTFGTTQGAKIVATQNYNAGDEVFCSYGPKSAADYLLEHGFCPPQCWKAVVSELTFEIDQDDRFYEDKLDILEYETYDQAPMDPVQSFDVISAPGRDGEPDPAMVQFVRLCKLGATDAFLLESIFRKEVWGFMSMPVSEANELKVVNAISEACQKAIDDLEQCPEGGPEVCKKLRESETRALSRTLAYLQREKEALDLKEYYQERRLKDLGLDSDWSPEDDGSDTGGFGTTRTPGGADYDF
jgi:[ribulose-bisphosphate carboxylase]/[fructose-bisphosphate aldolase]-lysine N-methyltransferase